MYLYACIPPYLSAASSNLPFNCQGETTDGIGRGLKFAMYVCMCVCVCVCVDGWMYVCTYACVYM